MLYNCLLAQISLDGVSLFPKPFQGLLLLAESERLILLVNFFHHFISTLQLSLGRLYQSS